MVSLADLHNAIAYEMESGKNLFDFILEETLAEPIVRMMMRADSVSELALRQLYLGPHRSTGLDARTGGSTQGRRAATSEERDHDEWQ